MTKELCASILCDLRKVSVCVVGDFAADVIWRIDQREAALEDSVPWLSSTVMEQKISVGAAGNVALNLVDIGIGKVKTVGVLGSDFWGQAVLGILESHGCDTRFMIQDESRLTDTYIKPFYVGKNSIEAEGSWFIFKNRRKLPEKTESQVLQHFSEEMDGFMITDHAHFREGGTCTDAIISKLSQMAGRFPEKPFVADARKYIQMYRNMTIVPNAFEAHCALDPYAKGENLRLEDSRQDALSLGETARNVCITRGEDGVLLYENNKFSEFPAIPVEGQIDTVGAGDSFAAGLIAALCVKRSLAEAVQFGIAVATVTLQKIGMTGTATPEEILSFSQ